MSAAPPDLEQERRRIAQRLEETARLSESSVPAGAFYGEMLKRLLENLHPEGDQVPGINRLAGSGGGATNLPQRVYNIVGKSCAISQKP